MVWLTRKTLLVLTILLSIRVRTRWPRLGYLRLLARTCLIVVRPSVTQTLLVAKLKLKSTSASSIKITRRKTKNSRGG